MTVSKRGGRASRRPHKDAAEGAVRVDAEGATVAISVHGPLDAAAGRALVETTRAAVTSAPERIDIDIRHIESHTGEGAAALVACRDLGAGLPEGLHYRTAKGPGGDALLAAFDDSF
jgi:hypothetical protein